MTSGIAYTESDWPLTLHPRFYYTDRLESEALALGVAEPPGRFRYRTSDTVLLTLALTRALVSRKGPGATVSDYMQERLWEPLGMEYDGLWNVDHEPGGLEKAACCLRATPRDIAKVGRLYLKGGDWNGLRLLPEAWVADTLRPDRDRGGSWQYQNHWWRASPGGGSIVARGHLGQFMLVDPERHLIIVRMGRGLGDLRPEQWTALLVEFATAVEEWQHHPA
jgi:CubicO group peptidase (beta-lactamase class C family)